MIKLSTAAQQNVDETGISPNEDVRRLRVEELTPEDLLEECLRGADEDRVQGWTEYVDAVVAAASAPASQTTRIILDNGGGITLQLGAWAHSYDGGTKDIARRAATDIRAWLETGSTKGWESNGAPGVNPTADDIRNGGYRVITIDRESDTAASLADEVRWGAMGEALGDALAAK